MICLAGNCIIANNFDLPWPHGIILVAEITDGKRVFSKRPDKTENILMLPTALGRNLDQFQVQINCVTGHESQFDFNRLSSSSGVSQ